MTALIFLSHLLHLPFPQHFTDGIRHHLLRHVRLARILLMGCLALELLALEVWASPLLLLLLVLVANAGLSRLGPHVLTLRRSRHCSLQILRELMAD